MTLEMIKMTKTKINSIMNLKNRKTQLRIVINREKNILSEWFF